jgi:hypothetical protein
VTPIDVRKRGCTQSEAGMRRLSLVFGILATIATAGFAPAHVATKPKIASAAEGPTTPRSLFIKKAAGDGVAGVPLARLASGRATNSESRVSVLEEAATGGDPDPKAWATRTLPMLKRQLARARELARGEPSGTHPH